MIVGKRDAGELRGDGARHSRQAEGSTRQRRVEPSPENPAARPRRFRFGPGLLLAVIASVVVWHLLPPQPRDVRDRRPSAERTATRADGVAGRGCADALGRPTTRVTTSAGLPGAPEPAWLLEQQKALGLSATQVRKLSRLRLRWDRNTRALRGELERASALFNQSMAAESGRGIALQQLQERMAPVSELSRQLADARRAWWEEAGSVLTVAQRQQVEQAWARRFRRHPDTRNAPGEK